MYSSLMPEKPKTSNLEWLNNSITQIKSCEWHNDNVIKD